jgi:chromosomal replication initiation ATPase DnaA
MVGINDAVHNIGDNGLIVPEMNPSRVIENVAKRYGLNAADLTSESRSQYVLKARWQAIRELHDLGLSSVEIGYLLHRDHTTILHALKRTQTAL